MFHLFNIIKKLFSRKRKKTYYTKAQKRKALTLLAKDVSPDIIAKTTKVNINTIYSWKLKSGISSRRRKIGIVLISQMRTAYLEGLSIGATAKRYGINGTSVFRRFTKWNKDAPLLRTRLAAMRANYKKSQSK